MIDKTKFYNFQPIQGEKIQLNNFTNNDITEHYLSWLNDPEVVKYSNQRFVKHSRSTSIKYLESFSATSNLFLAIYLKDEKIHVGTMTVYISDEHETADIGIMIGDRNWWGHGIGGDAWRTMQIWLLEEARIRKVTGGTLRCNKSMINIMLNCDMKSDGIRKAQELVGGEAQDILYFAKFRTI